MSTRIRTFEWWIAGILLVLAVVFAAGPRATLDLRSTPVKLPADLDGWLAQSEARFPDVRRDAGKRIVWANRSTKARTRYSVVYVHGFSATRMETAPLAETVAKALGANLYYTRLAGHGRSEDAMGEATLGAWLGDTREAYAIGQRLGERVVMIGTSTGGGLATLFAAGEEVADLHALVLISPNFGVRQWNAPIILWPWGEQIATLIVGDYRTWQASNPQQAQHWTMRYPVHALVPMMQSVALVNQLDLRLLKTPTLVFYARGDRLVDPGAVERRFAELGAPHKQLVPVDYAEDPAQHVLAGDILSPGATPRIAEAIVGFIQDLKDPAVPKK